MRSKNLTRNKALQQTRTQKKKLESNLLKQKNNSKLNFFIMPCKIFRIIYTGLSDRIFMNVTKKTKM